MISFLLIFLAGVLITFVISGEFTLAERCGFAFPIGIGLASFILFTYNLFLIRISLIGLHSILLLFVLIFSFIIYRKSAHNPGVFKINYSLKNLKDVNAVWMIFIGLIIYFVYAITLKCMYWPPAEFDTIAGYDLLAKGIAHERTIMNSIFIDPEMVKNCGPRLTYPPLVAYSNAICYLNGWETPKLITACFYISWVILFYSLLKRFVSATNAAFFTFLLILTPEMYAHASFSLTNLPCAIYISTAVISLLIWKKKNIKGFFYISLIMIICAAWTRSDTIVFTGPLLLIVFVFSVQKKNYKPFLLYSLSVLPYIIWSAFLKMYLPLPQNGFFIHKIFFDYDKLRGILVAALRLFFDLKIFGFTFYIFVIAILINIYGIIKKKEQHLLLFIIFFSLLFYTAVFYQLDTSDGSLLTEGGWMKSGYKRGLFTYAQLGIFFTAISKYVSSFFQKLENKLTFVR